MKVRVLFTPSGELKIEAADIEISLILGIENFFLLLFILFHLLIHSILDTKKIVIDTQAISSQNPFLYYKTTNRQVYDEARKRNGLIDKRIHFIYQVF